METAANTSKAIQQQTAAQQTAANHSNANSAASSSAATAAAHSASALNSKAVADNNPSSSSAANAAAASTTSNSAATISGIPSLKYGKPPIAFTRIEAQKLPKGWSIKSGDPLKLFEELNKEATFPAVSVVYDKKWSLGTTHAAATASHATVDLKTDKDYVDTYPRMVKGALVSRIIITRTENNPEKRMFSALMIRILFEEPGKKLEKNWSLGNAPYFHDLDSEIYDAVPGSAHYGWSILAGTNNLIWGFGEQELNDLEPKFTKHLQFCIGDMELRLARDFFKYLGILLTEEEVHYFQAMTCHQNFELDEDEVEKQFKTFLNRQDHKGLIALVQSIQEDVLDSSMGTKGGSLDDNEKTGKESVESDYSSHPGNTLGRFNKDRKRAIFDLGVSLEDLFPKHAIEIFASIKPRSIYYWPAQEKIIKMALAISRDTKENIKERRQYREKAIAKLGYLLQNGILIKSDKDRAKFFEVINSIASLLKEHAGVETVSLNEDLFELLKEGKNKIFDFFVDNFTNLYIASAKKMRMYKDPANKPLDLISLQKPSAASATVDGGQASTHSAKLAKSDQKTKADQKESVESTDITASMASATSAAALNSGQSKEKEHDKPLSKLLRPLQKELVVAPGWEVVKGELGKLAEENYMEPVILKRIEAQDPNPKASGIDIKVNQERAANMANAASTSAKQKEVEVGTDDEALLKEKKAFFSQMIIQREAVFGTQETVITLSFFKPLTADFRLENGNHGEHPETQRVFALRDKLCQALFGRYVYDGLSKLNFCSEYNPNIPQNQFTLTYRISAMRETMLNQFFSTLVAEGIFSDVEAQIFVKYFGHRLASLEEQAGLMDIQTELKLAEKAGAIQEMIACNKSIDRAIHIAKKIEAQALVEILPYLYPHRINLDGSVTVVPVGTSAPLDASAVFDLGEALLIKYKMQAVRVFKMVSMASPSFVPAQDRITNIAIDISGMPEAERLVHKISEEDQSIFRELAIRTLVVKLLESAHTDKNEDVDYSDQTLLHRLLASHAGYETMSNNSLFSTYVIKPKFTLGAAVELTIFMANQLWSMNPDNPELSAAKPSGSTVTATASTSSSTSASSSASTSISTSANASPNASASLVTFTAAPSMLTGFNMSAATAPTLSAAVSSASAATTHPTIQPATTTPAVVMHANSVASTTASPINK